MQDLELHKKLFINFLRTEKSLSENTIASYGLDLDKFLGYVSEVKQIFSVGKIKDETVMMKNHSAEFRKPVRLIFQDLILTVILRAFLRSQKKKD